MPRPAPSAATPATPRRVLVIRGSQSRIITPGSGDLANDTAAIPSLEATSEVLQSTLAPDEQ